MMIFYLTIHLWVFQHLNLKKVFGHQHPVVMTIKQKYDHINEFGLNNKFHQMFNITRNLYTSLNKMNLKHWLLRLSFQICIFWEQSIQIIVINKFYYIFIWIDFFIQLFSPIFKILKKQLYYYKSTILQIIIHAYTNYISILKKTSKSFKNSKVEC